MKKLIFLVCFIAAIFTVESVKAQQVFTKGDGILNASIGVGSRIYSGYGIGNFNTVIPPLAVSYEVGIVDNLIDGNASIGIGGYFGITSSRYRYFVNGRNYDNNSTAIVIGPRGSFHYQFVENLDTYAGLLLGAEIVSGDYGLGGAAVDTFIGARYYLNPNIAVMSEIGYGAIAYLNIGAAFRLR